MKKKLLIICYTFPPYNGIGGRRWAKFAKYLLQDNCEISVIAAKKQDASQSPWTKDISSYQDNINYLDAGYPLILQSNPKSIWQKIRYRLALFYVKLFLKGNYFDSSSFWEKKLIKVTERKILEGYNNVLVSCGPFKMASFFLSLKKKYPAVNFIVDFRDPWANNKTSFGYTSISSKRLEFEKELEKKVACNYDYVLCVSEEMTTYFSNLAPQDKHKNFLTISNGFDKDDFSGKSQLVRNENKLKFVFIGTLYDKSMHVFKEFCDVLQTIKKENALMFNSFQIEFYGQMPKSFFELIKDIDCIEFGGEIPLKQVYEKISSADLAMLFLTDDLNYSFSTKFYEYISQNISIAVFSKDGRTGRFVEENRLGYACFSSKIMEGIKIIHQDWENGNLRNNASFNTSDFNVEIISHQIQNILINTSI